MVFLKNAGLSNQKQKMGKYPQMTLAYSQTTKPDFALLKRDLTKICETFVVKKLSSFGSINTDRFDEHSDVDLLVTFGESDKGDLFERYFGFKERLEALFERPVELVFDKDFKNPYFRESIDRTRQVLYEA